MLLWAITGKEKAVPGGEHMGTLLLPSSLPLALQSARGARLGRTQALRPGKAAAGAAWGALQAVSLSPL